RRGSPGRRGGEGFRHVLVLSSREGVAAAEAARQPLWTDRRGDHGPFDLIGDVHGCAEELEELLGLLGYRLSEGAYVHPEGRTAIFLGDLVDRGPRVLDALRIPRSMAERGSALCLPGNHDVKFLRWLNGRRRQ